MYISGKWPTPVGEGACCCGTTTARAGETARRGCLAAHFEFPNQTRNRGRALLTPLQWIGLFAVVAVRASVLILDWTFSAQLTVAPFDIGRQVVFAQLLPFA